MTSTACLSPRLSRYWRACSRAIIPHLARRPEGISLHEIARQLGISRNTVRKYARALTQPINRPHNRGANGARHLPQLTAKRQD